VFKDDERRGSIRGASGRAQMEASSDLKDSKKRERQVRGKGKEANEVSTPLRRGGGAARIFKPNCRWKKVNC